MNDEYTVGRTAELAGVTVRTLHHYDEIGLVRASGRSGGGYRLYVATDIERLQQVLLYRRLGFRLTEIAALLDDPLADAVAHLRRQRALLLEQQGDLATMVAAIDTQLEAKAMGMQLTPEEQLAVFGTDKVGGEWADEAEQRWGETPAYQQSQRRMAEHTKDDWARLKAEADEAIRAFADALLAGVAATSQESMAMAERHRSYISFWFYECSYDVHRGLAEMYLADERFTRIYDDVEPGLARFIHDAIIANADRHA